MACIGAAAENGFTAMLGKNETDAGPVVEAKLENEFSVETHITLGS